MIKLYEYFVFLIELQIKRKKTDEYRMQRRKILWSSLDR